MNTKERILRAYLEGDLYPEIYEKLITTPPKEIDNAIEEFFNPDANGIQHNCSYQAIRILLNFHSNLPVPAEYLCIASGFEKSTRFDFSKLPALREIATLFQETNWKQLNVMIAAEKYVSRHQYSKLVSYYQKGHILYYVSTILQIPFTDFDQYLDGSIPLTKNHYLEAMEKLKKIRETMFQLMVQQVKSSTDVALNLTEEDVKENRLVVANMKFFLQILDKFLAQTFSEVDDINTEYLVNFITSTINDFVAVHKAVPEFMYVDYFHHYGL